MRVARLSRGAVSWAETLAADLLAASTRETAMPRVLICYPVAHLNPFQHLLYQGAEAAGFTVVPAVRVDEFAHAGWARRAVIHLHWLAAWLRFCKTPEDAAQAVRAADARLADWRRRGYQIVWTVHNILPHGSRHLEAEVALRRVAARRAHRIHVMSANTADAVAAMYALPASKVFHVPHPSYAGWYPAFQSRAAARADLELPPGDFVFLFFGSLQPYKGVLALLEAYDALRGQSGPRVRLVIAGKPSDAAYAREVGERVRGRADILYMPESIPDAQVQTLFAASDVVVAPYVRTLNSGVALLAATFGRMVVGPLAGAIRETFEEDPALLYDAEAPDGLRNAMARAITHVPCAGVLSRILARHEPADVSARFFSHLKSDLSLAVR